MADFDSAMMKDMAKLKNINEADELLRGMKESGKEEHKNEYSTFKEVEELRLMVEKQKYLLHAFWLMLKEHGATNEDLDKALNEAVLLSKRTDYKNVVSCPNCGKGLQKMENEIITLEAQDGVKPTETMTVNGATYEIISVNPTDDAPTVSDTIKYLISGK